MDVKFLLKKIEVTSICVFKKVIEKIHLQDAFHLENIKVTFQISCRPYFQDGMFLRVASLFRTITR